MGQVCVSAQEKSVRDGVGNGETRECSGAAVGGGGWQVLEELGFWSRGWDH